MPRQPKLSKKNGYWYTRAGGRPTYFGKVGEITTEYPTMLARYKIHRGRRPAVQPLPDGIRQDTRKHTRHCLRPTAEIVATYLAKPTAANWRKFKAAYRKCLAERYADDPKPFDGLASQAAKQDVFIGCSCPTKKNPDVNHCHTVLALEFMAKHYPELEVQFPAPSERSTRD